MSGNCFRKVVNSGPSSLTALATNLGDNSPWGSGIFFEGIMTKGFASDVVDARVFSDVVDARYGV